MSGECLRTSGGWADFAAERLAGPKAYVSGIAADGRIVVIGWDSKTICRMP
jgi:hypothetical protein